MTHYPYATSPWVRQRTPVHTPARQVVAPTGSIIRGLFPSVKARRMVPFEQLLELDALYLFEFAPQVVDIREQPFKLQYAMGNKVRRYTPDYALILRDGDILIVEVKPSRSLAKPEVHEKLLYVRDAMVRQGHQFIVLSSDTIRMPYRLDNLKRLHRFLGRPLAPDKYHQLHQLRARLGKHVILPFDSLIQHLGGMNDVFGLLAHGELSCDLGLPLSSDTLISLDPNEEADYVFVDSL